MRSKLDLTFRDPRCASERASARDPFRGQEMRDGRKWIDELRDRFQDGIDGIERATGGELDRFASRSRAELSQIREAMGDSRRRSKDKSARKAAKRDRKAQRRLHRRGRRRRKSKRDDRTPEEIEFDRATRRARRRAGRRIGFSIHFGVFVGTLGIILVASRSLRVTLIVALSWGIGVFIHYIAAIAAPRLRYRVVKDETLARSPRAIETERARVSTRSRRSMEDLSASIAHEIRNPITAAKSLVQQMGEDPDSRDNLEYADVALAELDRVERSISHLLRYARDEEPRFDAVSMESIVLASAEGLRARAAEAGVQVDVDFEGPGAIRGDVEKLRRVIENLIANAIDVLAESHADSPRIEIVGGENLARTEVWIRVSDNGPGVSEADRERIWSPFFTTKETGTGLGLALSRKTVEAHGGRIELQSDSARGSEFVLVFPRDEASDAD